MKKCRTCHRLKPLGEFYSNGHKNKTPDCKLCVKKQKRVYHALPETKARLREYRQRVRNQFFALYGNKCSLCACPILEFLEIDHIGGGGRQHRKQCGGNIRMWKLVIAEGYRPDKYRTLCRACNQLSRWFSLQQLKKWWKPKYKKGVCNVSDF